MDAQQRLEAAIEKAKRREPKQRARSVPPFKRTSLAPDAPAPRTSVMIAQRGQELSTRAVEAWASRLEGTPMVDLAHEMGISIPFAKTLINEAHAAIGEDLKENLELNRQLDLSRIDGLLKTYYAQARSGDLDAANMVLKCLGHRAKLTGAEPPPQPGKTDQPQNVLIWIQNQMPAINRLVDALPIE
jgi:hypothetical protein